MANLVEAPTRRPRTGGLQAVTGAFRTLDRFGPGDLAWEDSGCGFPSDTQAGCFDTAFPLNFDDVVVSDEDNSFTFHRVGDTVTVTYNVTAVGAYVAPWTPTEEVTEAVTEGDIVLGTDGALEVTADAEGTPTGTGEFTFTTDDPQTGGYVQKQYDGPSAYTSVVGPFAKYAGVKCWLGGDQIGDSYLEQARKLLAAGEDRAVEERLVEWAEAGSGPAPVATLVDAVADAVNAADGDYVGEPLVIMNRGDAERAFAAGVLERDGGRLVTGTGVSVLATSAATVGTVSVIGWPTVWASAVVAHPANDLRRNEALAIAERVYEIGVDCDYRAVVTVGAP